MHVKDNNALSLVVDVVGKVRGGIYEIFGQQKQTGTENGKKKPSGKDTCGPILYILDTTIHCEAQLLLGQSMIHLYFQVSPSLLLFLANPLFSILSRVSI